MCSVFKCDKYIIFKKCNKKEPEYNGVNTGGYKVKKRERKERVLGMPGLASVCRKPMVRGNNARGLNHKMEIRHRE